MGNPNYKFKSKFDAVRRAKRVYVCKMCETWHTSGKPTRCLDQNCRHDDFIHFGSHAEARRYAELRLLENHGNISKLELQPSFPIDMNGVKICTYRADFAYHKGSERIVEDVKPKGFMTDVAKLKIKLASAQYGVEIKIVERG